MSLEAVQRVSEAEEKARARRTEAAVACKKLVSDTEQSCQAQLEQVCSTAQSQAVEALVKAKAAAEKEVKAIQQETKQACTSLRQMAAKRLDAAAALIIRRVGGDSCP